MDYSFIAILIVICIGAGRQISLGCFYDRNLCGKNKFSRSMFFITMVILIWISGFVTGAYLENIAKL